MGASVNANAPKMRNASAAVRRPAHEHATHDAIASGFASESAATVHGVDATRLDASRFAAADAPGPPAEPARDQTIRRASIRRDAKKSANAARTSKTTNGATARVPIVGALAMRGASAARSSGGACSALPAYGDCPRRRSASPSRRRVAASTALESSGRA